jgi:hypothetical protein
MHLLLKAAAWVGVGLTITALLAMVTFAMLLNSQRFHSYLLRTMQTKATAVLGVPVRLQDFVLHLSTLSIDLYGVTIDGASPYPNPPLLQVDHVEARVRVTSILRGTWNLETLRIDRPVVQIFFDTRGRSNIPTLKSGARSNSSIGMFDLAIGHASLTQGEVFYNNRPSALAVDLHDLTLHSSFDTLLGKYSGSLAYSNGRLIYGALRPLLHNLDAQFAATPTTFDLIKSRLTVGPSQFLLSAVLHDYRNPSVQAHYDFTVDGSQVAQLLRNQLLPSGNIRVAGSVLYQPAQTIP